MGMKFSSFKTDTTKESDGVWVDAGEGMKLKLARYGNPKFDDYLRKLSTPLQRRLIDGTISQSAMEKLEMQAMSIHVLKGWEGLQDDQGKDIQYSPEVALELMTSARDFFKLVRELSQRADHYRTSVVENAMGNSEPSSGGNSTTGTSSGN